jgi:hypothetical protein
LSSALFAAPLLADQPSISLQGIGPADAAATVPEALLGSAWTNAAPMPVPVVHYAHAQCEGENVFYVISGVTTAGALTGATQRYDAATNTWTQLAPVPIPSEGPTGVCHAGRIYVAGGGSQAGSQNFLVYDIAANTWTPGPALPRVVTLGHMGAYAGRVYLAGGDTDFVASNGVSNVVNVYDVASNTWLANGAPMPTGVTAAGFDQIGSFLYVVGGFGTASPAANVNQTQRYDMATNTWQTGPVFTSARADLAVAATAVALYAIGGDNNGGGVFDLSSIVERLDLSAWPGGTWTTIDPLPSPRTALRGGFCTEAFFPATGEVWSSGGVTPPFPTFSNENLYREAEACPGAAVADAAPVGLEVDPAPGGNRVLEPNEPSVVVAPIWENISSVTIASLTGLATDFSGPAGAVYTIDDATADYGTLAPGDVRSCLATGDCYEVTVTAATRPATHWDAVLTETLSPFGTLKEWTIHVGASFTDVPTTNAFYRFVETILHNGVTGGCTTTAYCPNAATTREQMAVFVLLAREGAGYTPPACTATPMFADVPNTSPFCPYIEELARRGVVTGCDAANYCPTAATTREQMAVFVLRALDPTLNPPACTVPAYNDVPPSSPFCRWIEEVTRRAIVTGCGNGSYCPTLVVTRETMSVFLTETFGLVLYGV